LPLQRVARLGESMEVDEALVLLAETLLLAATVTFSARLAHIQGQLQAAPPLSGILEPGEYAVYYNGSCIVSTWNGVYDCCDFFGEGSWACTEG